MPIRNQKKNLEAKSQVWRKRGNSLAVGKQSKGVIDQLSAPVVDCSHVKNTVTLKVSLPWCQWVWLTPTIVLFSLAGAIAIGCLPFVGACIMDLEMTTVHGLPLF